MCENRGVLMFWGKMCVYAVCHFDGYSGRFGCKVFIDTDRLIKSV